MGWGRKSVCFGGYWPFACIYFGSLSKLTMSLKFSGFFFFSVGGGGGGGRGPGTVRIGVRTFC